MFYQQPLIVQLVKQPDAEARPLTELSGVLLKVFIHIKIKGEMYETLFGRGSECSQ